MSEVETGVHGEGGGGADGVGHGVAAVGGTGGDVGPAGVRIPLLVSGILNCLAALGWISTCALSFLAIPLIVLAVYEFLTFAKLGEPDYRRNAGRVKTLQILEICSILLGNLGSMICGIIGLVMGNQEREKGNF